MSAVRLEGVRKVLGGRPVLALERLEIEPGELFVLLGPSGSGKSTLLRVLAGLLRPDAGRVFLFGRDVAGVPPHRRSIGVVFQGLALWPHMSVRGNIALGLDTVLPDAASRARRIEETASLLGVDRFLDARPSRLSGGERQRVALARALVRRPALLLLDEPFSDLDARTRRASARLLRHLHDEHGMTTFLITHDRTDAHLLADRIALLRDGALAACGTPERLHADPGGRFPAEFLSDAAVLSGTVTAEGCLLTALGPMPLAEPAPEGIRLLVALRPDEIRVGAGPVEGEVVACEFAGGPWRVRIAVGEAEVAALHDRRLAHGARVRIAPPSAPRRAFPEER
jgi:ABC-type Fe3+/spermidine/putrescine transport system ATPase subunit